MTNRIATVILFLALCAGTISARATAVVSFTASPNVVSNTYNGVITLQINGLTNGVTNVVVQKFLDVNTNGVIDSGDPLVQQFRLAVGQANVFTNMSTMTPVTVTNFMPGDTSSATDQITVPLNFQNGDFAQTLVGQYLYKVSSPSGGFAAVTNLFVVTNAFFSSCVTGAVFNASLALTPTNIPNAIVLLCITQNGAINVQAGTVANSAGNFLLRAPPGSYFMAAAKSNFVEDVTVEGVSLVAKQTNDGSVGLTPATTNITGRIVNAANSNGLAGVSGMVISTNNLLSFYFTDTNGNFYAPVVTNLWEAPVDAFAAAFQSCLTRQFDPFFNVSNKLVSFTNALPQATAIFYGVVSNSSAVPLPGVYLYAADDAGHQSLGMTDIHGRYVVGVAGTNQWQLSILSTNNPGVSTNNVISPGEVQTNGLGPGQAVQQNFSVLSAPYTISGTVADLDGNPIGGVEIFATNANFQAFPVWTASDGTYALNVSPNKAWTVGINPATLEALGYTNIPANQVVNFSESDVSGVNFSIEVCTEILILTTNLPDAMVGQYYNASILGESCHNINNWSTAFGITLTSLYDHTNVIYPAGTPIYSESGLIGYVETYFDFGVTSTYPNSPWFTNCSGTTVPVGSSLEFENLSATVNVTGPITNSKSITVYLGSQPWTASPTTQNGSSYSTTLTLSEYPANLSGLYASQDYVSKAGNPLGQKMTTTTAAGVSNRVASVLGVFRSVPVFGNSVNAASSIPYTNLANSVVWITYGTNTGQYFISAYGPLSTNMDGLSLYPAGTTAASISGTPISTGTNGGVFNFSIMAEDVSSNVTVQPVSLFVFPATGITGPSSAQAGQLQSSNTFQMRLSGLTNEFNYIVLMSTNLPSTNWVPILTVNNPTTNSISIPDTSATNATRFYRLQISQ